MFQNDFCTSLIELNQSTETNLRRLISYVMQHTVSIHGLATASVLGSLVGEMRSGTSTWRETTSL